LQLSLTGDGWFYTLTEVAAEEDADAAALSRRLVERNI
jgi:hypothetical protein